jgi:hypothetical protein
MPTATDPTLPSITLQSGTFSATAGSGAFARVIEQSGTGTVIDSTRTTTGGVSSTSQVIVTDNPDGSVTRDSTVTNAQGATTTTDVTIGAMQNGVQVIAGTLMQADGTVDQVNGAVFATATGFSEYLLLTDPTGATSTSTAAFVHGGSSSSMTVDGTGFGGNPFEWQSTSTVLSTVVGNAADMTGFTLAGGAAFAPPTDTTGAGFAAIVPSTPADLLSGGTNTL